MCMCMHVCICMCVCKNVHVCVHVHVYACVCICMCVCKNVHVCVHVCTFSAAHSSNLIFQLCCLLKRDTTLSFKVFSVVASWHTPTIGSNSEIITNCSPCAVFFKIETAPLHAVLISNSLTDVFQLHKTPN